jgi:pimeloyl-ACP methyl ester carboxylesterase
MPTTTRTPVVFIHGLWLHASSWGPWLDLFAEAGYAPVAPGWPGDSETVELSRAHPDSIAGYGIEEVTTHYAAIIEQLPARPVIIGHSFGGMIAEKLLGEDLGAAAIGIDAAQIKGVLPLPLSALRSTLPVFKNPANAGRAVSLTAEQFRFGFGNAVSPEESDALYERWAIPAPGKPLFQAAAANFSLHSPAKVDTGNRSCSSWAAGTTPCPRPSPSPLSSSTAAPTRSPSWPSSPTGGTASRSTAAGAR